MASKALEPHSLLCCIILPTSQLLKLGRDCAYE